MYATFFVQKLQFTLKWFIRLGKTVKQLTLSLSPQRAHVWQISRYTQHGPTNCVKRAQSGQLVNKHFTDHFTYFVKKNTVIFA